MFMLGNRAVVAKSASIHLFVAVNSFVSTAIVSYSGDCLELPRVDFLCQAAPSHRELLPNTAVHLHRGYFHHQDPPSGLRLRETRNPQNSGRFTVRERVTNAAMQ
ncbi:hypothetical protein H2248_000606 [Termitomyces sp. 'cryptogamus']|nr:hypothetical protein H2248_000606 [Termitomyces sp. 'cryptogamus']